MAIIFPKNQLSKCAPEPEIDPTPLVQHADQIEILIKLITYIGPQHEDVPVIAEDLYRKLYGPKPEVCECADNGVNCVCR